MKNMKKINDEFVNALGPGEVMPPAPAELEKPCTAGFFQEAIIENKEHDEISKPCTAGVFPPREYISLEARKEIFETGRIIGHYDGLNFARQVLTVAQIAKLVEIRETRVYRKTGFVNWENFCREVIGTNVDVIDEQIRNFKKFGPAFLEAATRISLSRSVFRQLRALPDEELKQVVSGSVVRIEGEEIPLDEEHGPEINMALETLLAKRKGETEKLREKADTAAKKLLEKDVLLDRRDAEIDRLKRTVEEIRGRDETYLEIQERVLQVYGRTLAQLDQLYQAVLDIVDPGTRERLCSMFLPELGRKMQGITGVIIGYDVPEVEE